MLDCGGDSDAPIVLGILDDVGEIGIEQEIMQRGIAFVGINDAVQKFRANDTTAAPDSGDVAEIQVPVVLFTGRAEQFHSLCVRDDLGCVKSVAHGIDQLFPVACKFFRLRLWENFRRRNAFIFSRRDHARFDSCVDCRNDNGLSDGGLQRPHAGPFLAGLIENHIDKRFTGFRIDLAKNLRGDFDQVTVELAFVPFGEGFRELFIIHPDDVIENAYASQINCMSPYSIPLCTILT